MRQDVHGIPVIGQDVDKQTRCRHYATERDIIAIKFSCCDTYYPCFLCHQELADHAAQTWPSSRFDDKAILCGSCGSELTVNEYMQCDYHCPNCKSAFNPACHVHKSLYFETP